jgi:hypothetical protein
MISVIAMGVRRLDGPGGSFASWAAPEATIVNAIHEKITQMPGTTGRCETFAVHGRASINSLGLSYWRVTEWRTNIPVARQHPATSCGVVIFKRGRAAFVAQICNLPYRGLAVRRRQVNFEAPVFSQALPNEIRRYGGLKICATTNRQSQLHPLLLPGFREKSDALQFATFHPQS